MVRAEVSSISHRGAGFLAAQVGMTVRAHSRIALHERGGLFVLHVTRRALGSWNRDTSAVLNVDVVLDTGVAREAFLVTYRLERLHVAGIAAVADRLVRGVQGTRGPERIAGQAVASPVADPGSRA